MRNPDPAPQASNERDLREAIESALRDYRCQYWQYDEGEDVTGGGMALVDILSDERGSIRTGEKELELLADELAYKLQARLRTDPDDGSEGEEDGPVDMDAEIAFARLASLLGRPLGPVTVGSLIYHIDALEAELEEYHRHYTRKGEGG